eukprot:CAMPEP_0184857346 /NCGR_PEP_ID=MMETSP0580-20130426/2515_1 /TAXON_ID=1118495 /ORGANISM="Dactyliosolen fragilissimus" /LENGTH=295 /DNA_ID=CAMNT_0027352903 /DNA_START=1248 /DNA_END=2132 /DNA_ORIENTATION=+
MQFYTGTSSQQPNSNALKIVALVRNPLERAWSSYKYNYLTPLLSTLREGTITHHHTTNAQAIPSGKSDEFYIENYAFSFEDMIRAEVYTLKKCLKPNSDAEIKSNKMFRNKTWAKHEFERRKSQGLPPLIALDETCYGNRISKDVPRLQWTHMVKESPERIINVPNLHLVQSFLGRGLYLFPLEWWYMIYHKEDIMIICNEDLKERPHDTMHQVTQFLGLPTFNFTPIVSEGMYNVGGHRGYDVATPWNETSSIPKDNYLPEDIPLSSKLRKKILNFIQPYNRRLFNLTGQKCNW